MPVATGVVQEAGVPVRPSISTRHRRQEPKASSMSVAQSFGICVPSSIAARMIEVPSGTVTALAVDGQRDRLLGFGRAACRSRFRGRATSVVSLFRGLQARRRAPKSSGKWVSALITG